MANKIAFLFPGQGAQFVGMGRDLYDAFDGAKKVFDTANDVLGKDISGICFNGPEDELKKTINTQPAIVTMSIAALEVLKNEFDILPSFAAGHSLGEYCAMYSAGVMTLENTLKSIKKRSELMAGVSGGTMAAVLNAPDGSVERVLNAVSEFGYVDVANYNSPVQIVITGDDSAVAKASEMFIQEGARRVVPLAVSGAFHSKYMKGATEEFEKFVSGVEINDAHFPVITNVDAQATVLSDEFRSKMPKQISSSVFWTQSVENMVSNGVDIFIEIGPGKVLAGLNKKINPDIITYNVYDKLSLENTIDSLRSLCSKC